MGTYSGKILFWAYLVSTLVTPGMGYIYDILGRYKVLIASSFILSFVLGIIPYSSPYFWLLCAERAIISTLINVMAVSPLIIDYIKSESRGMVMSFASLGFVFGELLMVGIFSSTRGMTIPL